jgi:hypothetical protein
MAGRCISRPASVFLRPQTTACACTPREVRRDVQTRAPPPRLTPSPPLSTPCPCAEGARVVFPPEELPEGKDEGDESAGEGAGAGAGAGSSRGTSRRPQSTAAGRSAPSTARGAGGAGGIVSQAVRGGVHANGGGTARQDVTQNVRGPTTYIGRPVERVLVPQQGGAAPGGGGGAGGKRKRAADDSEVAAGRSNGAASASGGGGKGGKAGKVARHSQAGRNTCMQRTKYPQGL